MGETLYLEEVYPDVLLLSYFEFYYRSNDDVAFVYPLQKVKLVAYPFGKYGMLDGEVINMGPEASERDTQSQSTDGGEGQANRSRDELQSPGVPAKPSAHGPRREPRARVRHAGHRRDQPGQPHRHGVSAVARAEDVAR